MRSLLLVLCLWLGLAQDSAVRKKEGLKVIGHCIILVERLMNECQAEQRHSSGATEDPATCMDQKEALRGKKAAVASNEADIVTFTQNVNALIRDVIQIKAQAASKEREKLRHKEDSKTYSTRVNSMKNEIIASNDAKTKRVDSLDNAIAQFKRILGKELTTRGGEKKKVGDNFDARRKHRSMFLELNSAIKAASAVAPRLSSFVQTGFQETQGLSKLVNLIIKELEDAKKEAGDEDENKKRRLEGLKTRYSTLKDEADKKVISLDEDIDRLIGTGISDTGACGDKKAGGASECKAKQTTMAAHQSQIKVRVANRPALKTAVAVAEKNLWDCLQKVKRSTAVWAKELTVLQEIMVILRMIEARLNAVVITGL